MLTIALETPIVPKKNSFAVGVSKTGRPYQYRSKRAVASENALAWEIAAGLRNGGWKETDKPVRIEINLLATRADAIGLMETVADALERSGAIKDDKQIVDCHYKAVADMEGKFTAIMSIEEISADAQN